MDNELIYNAFKSLDDVDNSIIDDITIKEPQDKLIKESLEESRQKLFEEAYSLTDEDSIQELEKEIDKEEEPAIEKVVDIEADSKDDLKDSYVGNVIIQCDTCHTLFYKQPDELVSEDDEELVNIGEKCPVCSSEEGYNVIGKVAPLEDNDQEEEKDDATEDENIEEVEVETPEETVEEEEIKESLSSEKEEILLEDKELTLDNSMDFLLKDEDEAIDGYDKVIKLVNESSLENKQVIIDTLQHIKEEELEHVNELNDIKKLLEFTTDTISRDVDIEINNFEESYFDNLVNKFLEETYEDINFYKTTDGNLNEDLGVLELDGIIYMKNNTKKPTKFIFESKEIDPSYRMILKGKNTTFSPNDNAFNLVCKLSRGALIAESLNYSYKVGEVLVEGLKK